MADRADILLKVLSGTQFGVEVALEDDLLSGELLYSLAVMRLASWVEETFAIEMTPANLTVENFQTVAALTDFVTRATEGRGSNL